MTRKQVFFTGKHMFCTGKQVFLDLTRSREKRQAGAEQTKKKIKKIPGTVEEKEKEK